MKKPTIEEIGDYCASRSNGIDPEAFWHFYESKGWVVGKAPMKSWQSAVITWEKKQLGNTDTYDRPTRGSADWYHQRQARRVDAGADDRILDGDGSVVRLPVAPGARRGHS